MIDSYAWRGEAREAVLRLGPLDGPMVLILPPLFEEANRTRFFLVEVMRGLAGHGIVSLLPDLPGTNDSLVPTIDARLADWRDAVAALPVPIATVALRGGALLDDAARTDRHWRLAPEGGGRLLRDMIRATAITSRLKAAEIEASARTNPTTLAGSDLHPELFVALHSAAPVVGGAVRTARLDDDAAEADVRIMGTPLWRRAEPDHDPLMAEAMVADLTSWLA